MHPNFSQSSHLNRASNIVRIGETKDPPSRQDDGTICPFMDRIRTLPISALNTPSHTTCQCL